MSVLASILAEIGNINLHVGMSVGISNLARDTMTSVAGRIASLPVFTVAASSELFTKPASCNHLSDSLKSIVTDACVSRLQIACRSEAAEDRGASAVHAKGVVRQLLQWPQHYISRGDWAVLEDASTVAASRDRIIAMRLKSVGIPQGCSENG